MTTDKEDECFWNILQRDTIANSKDFKLLEDNTRENKNFKNPEQKIQILKHMKILNLIIWEKQKKMTLWEKYLQHIWQRPDFHKIYLQVNNEIRKDKEYSWCSETNGL